MDLHSFWLVGLTFRKMRSLLCLRSRNKKIPICVHGSNFEKNEKESGFQIKKIQIYIVHSSWTPIPSNPPPLISTSCTLHSHPHATSIHRVGNRAGLLIFELCSLIPEKLNTTLLTYN